MRANPRRRARAARRGLALIIVFWLIAILSLAIFTTVRVVKNDTDVMISQKKAFRATQLAEMGIAFGANPTVSETDYQLLNQQISEDEGFSVRLRGEGGKFNINAILVRQDRELMERILTAWGLEEEQASEITSNLIDWVDEDEFEQLNGAEADFYLELGYPNYPFNRPFYSLDEMRYVYGMELVMLIKPNWRDYFTIWSGGRLDLNEAEPELIAIATEAPLEEALELVQMRWGEDGIEDTEDDYQFRSINEVLALLGSAPESGVFLNQRLTLNDPTTRIESIGAVGDFRKKIVVVVRNRSNRPEILIREDVPLF